VAGDGDHGGKVMRLGKTGPKNKTEKGRWKEMVKKGPGKGEKKTDNHGLPLEKPQRSTLPEQTNCTVGKPCGKCKKARERIMCLKDLLE